jgi:Family of unknown function (DUF6069)
MTTTTIIESTRPRAFRVTGIRVLGVVGATLAALAVWVVAVPLLGLHLLIRFGTSAPQGVGIEAVALSSLVGSLAGWGVLALLEMRTSRALAIWTGVAIAGVAASLTLPLVAGTTSPTKAALALMHLSVGAVLIPALRRRSSH